VLPGRPVELAARAAHEGVIDRDPDRHVGVDQQVDDQVGEQQAELVGLPACAGEEPVRAMMDHTCDRRAPSSIPVTVRWLVWARNPQHNAVNVAKVGAVKQGRNQASSPASDEGCGGIGDPVRSAICTRPLDPRIPLHTPRQLKLFVLVTSYE
jgi:hypothetical protein